MIGTLSGQLAVIVEVLDDLGIEQLEGNLGLLVPPQVETALHDVGAVPVPLEPDVLVVEATELDLCPGETRGGGLVADVAGRLEGGLLDDLEAAEVGVDLLDDLARFADPRRCAEVLGGGAAKLGGGEKEEGEGCGLGRDDGGCATQWEGLWGRADLALRLR